MESNMVHKTSKVLYPFTQQFINIDNGLVSVMQALWDAGFETIQSCQDGVIVFNEDYGFTQIEQIMKDHGLNNICKHVCDDCVWDSGPYIIYNFEGI